MYKGKEKETIRNGRLFLCPDNCLCRDYAPRYPFRSNCQVKAILHGRIETGAEIQGGAQNKEKPASDAGEKTYEKAG